MSPFVSQPTIYESWCSRTDWLFPGMLGLCVLDQCLAAWWSCFLHSSQNLGGRAVRTPALQLEGLVFWSPDRTKGLSFVEFACSPHNSVQTQVTLRSEPQWVLPGWIINAWLVCMLLSGPVVSPTFRMSCCWFPLFSQISHGLPFLHRQLSGGLNNKSQINV